MKPHPARRLRLCIALAFSVPLLAQAPPSLAPISLQQALELARAKNSSLLAAREHVSATRASEITAGLRQNPMVALTGQDVTLPADNPGNPYFYSANVSRLFERGQKRHWRLESARGSTLVATSQDQDQERGILLNVKTAFTNMLLAKQALNLSEENLGGYRHTVDLSRERLKAGDISETDFERIDLQLAAFESDEEKARLNVVQASDQLQVLLGIVRPDPHFDITGTLDPPVLNVTLQQLEKQALDGRPDYKSAMQSVALAQSNIHVADSMGTTDPTIGSEYERSGRDNTFGASISIPLRIFDRNQGEKQRTRYEMRASIFAEAAARSQVYSDVDQAWASYGAAIAQARRYNGHYLQEATHVRDNLEFSYRTGGTTLLDYLDALREYRQTHLDALNANAQVWLSIHQLSFATATEILP
jgi:cobalt-zinc-cadmium efflux system outer membrane protein